jgi:hypothetical protein
MKVSNQMIEKMLNEDEDGKPKKNARKPFCTKCKGSSFNDNSELRVHYKSNWHNFNVKLIAHGKDSLTAEEFDEYTLMHPEVLK